MLAQPNVQINKVEDIGNPAIIPLQGRIKGTSTASYLLSKGMNNFKEYETFDKAIAGLKAGDIHALVYDKPMLQYEEKLQEKKRRIEKTAKALLEIEYKNKIDDFLENKLPFLENNQMSPSVAKALLQVEMEEKIDSMMRSGQAMKMVLNEIPMLVDNLLEDNISQIKLLESKNTITDEDVEIFEEHEKDLEKEGTISKEELESKWGVQT